MKLAILGDSHFGVRNDSQIFHNHFRKFYQEVFFPRIHAEGIKYIIQTGDLFDRRKFINFNTLHSSQEYFFDEFLKSDIKLITYLGNHDCYYKNTLQVNSPELTLGYYVMQGAVEIIKKPVTMTLNDDFTFDVIPWICSDNEYETKEFIKNSKSSICFGHFEISGFSMEKGSVCFDGMNREDLNKYEMVISGHFHHRSTDGHIYYVGTPCEHTWADYDDQRGFHIFDTETRLLEFIPNPSSMFHKVVYNDANETLESIDSKDYAEYYQKYVKVVVEQKNSMVLFDRFISHFYNAQPADLGIVEDFTEYNNLSDLMNNAGLDQAENTNVLLDKYVETLEIGGIDKEKMKAVMRNIYNQAQAMENT